MTQVKEWCDLPARSGRRWVRTGLAGAAAALAALAVAGVGELHSQEPLETRYTVEQSRDLREALEKRAAGPAGPASAEAARLLRLGDRLARLGRSGAETRARFVFAGPPGTGKTMAASIIGDELGKDVYRIDLAGVVSKYIGETEKNLERIFDRADSLDWILFVDEADALFARRTDVRDGHDRYADQEVSYLLRRLSDHDGIIILGTRCQECVVDSPDRDLRITRKVRFPLKEEEDEEPEP